MIFLLKSNFIYFKSNQIESFFLWTKGRMPSSIVPKHQQSAYALERFNISDLSALPADWNPSTHYPCGRPITPSWPLKDRSEYETDDGAWIIAEPTPFVPTPYTSPHASPVLRSVGNNMLLWDDQKAKCTFVLDENKVGEIPAKCIMPLMAKLIKKVKLFKKEITLLSKREKALEKALP